MKGFPNEHTTVSIVRGLVHGGTDKEYILTKWMSDLTPNTEMFMRSDKILTLVDPNLKLVNSYYETIR